MTRKFLPLAVAVACMMLAPTSEARGPRDHHHHTPNIHSHHGHMGHGYGHYHYTPPPPPPRPLYNHYYAPAPPVAVYRPANPFATILGLALGTAINVSVNALVNSGYNVTGYTGNAVYVTNAPMLNMVWPTATLHYNTYGGLCSSEFVYTTPAYDMVRYNTAYNSLVLSYGNPYTSTNANGVITTTWCANNQFVRLMFYTGYANGGTCYYTTLSFGN